MAIIGSGLLLFAILIGNIQNFLQALGRRYNLPNAARLIFDGLVLMLLLLQYA